MFFSNTAFYFGVNYGREEEEEKQLWQTGLSNLEPVVWDVLPSTATRMAVWPSCSCACSLFSTSVGISMKFFSLIHFLFPMRTTQRSACG